MTLPSTSPNPLVAIVTPVYNGARYLAETMACVQAQDYLNIVHVVLDNASTDDTPAILAKFANKKVPVIVSRNQTLLSLNANWNAAVALIPPEAKYFRTLCADDVIAPQFLTRAVALGEQYPNVGVVGTLFHENDGPTREIGWPSDRETLSGADALARYFRGEMWLPSAHALFRCSELALQRPFFHETSIANDLTGTFGVLSRRDMGIVYQDLAMTRLHDAGVTAQVLGKEMLHYCEWLYYLKTYSKYAFGENAAEDMSRLYRRRYLRQMVRWLVRGDADVFSAHMKCATGLGTPLSMAAFADAIFDWPAMKAGLRRAWSGYPF